MPSLSLKRWVRYEPALPGNAELPVEQRFYLEVLVGLSTLEWEGMRKAFTAAWRKLATENTPDSGAGAALAAAVEGFVRFGKEPLTLETGPVTDVAGYLQALAEQHASPLLTELFECLLWHNGYEGKRVVFSVRSFGGAPGTTSTKTEPAENQTAAH